MEEHEFDMMMKVVESERPDKNTRAFRVIGAFEAITDMTPEQVRVLQKYLYGD